MKKGGLQINSKKIRSLSLITKLSYTTQKRSTRGNFKKGHKVILEIKKGRTSEIKEIKIEGLIKREDKYLQLYQKVISLTQST
ncbi:unnamed protein product (macronuclear) [Paramecium tetraurelia]|uniref:Ribosomal protein S4 n=1 Tax=Paramecium tetraurelia TaxID=5888 RepID=A0D4L9_PARTE|nr:uncharacterized protein GSPATT00039264001 [Paramecium tetraurelia]CAK77986.1 unnamed protein product [Paramecium tetraurelia]|eukprot:XP_001445383.1 hypothetical protein (macronuclear) [Paramecium tetraurelia strain d4-2]